jgi:hypothetical protein
MTPESVPTAVHFDDPKEGGGRRDPDPCGALDDDFSAVAS